MAKPSGVYMFMGVNGVGKSTLVDNIGATLHEAEVVHASQELRAIFGGVSREELELLDPADKLNRRAAHFTALFQKSQISQQLVIMDTHLLVPIRQGGTVRYENTWSDNYTPFVKGAYMITAKPSEIKAWREKNGLATGRIRDLNLDNIVADQELNILEFANLVDSGALPAGSEIVSNREGLLGLLGLTVINNVLI